MKKLLYAAIVAFLFVGGLAAGIVHKQSQANKNGGGDAAAVPSETTGLSLSDLGASTPTEGLPTDGQTSETLTLDLSAATAVAAAPTPEAEMTSDASGRSFGSGSAPEPASTRSSSGSSGSSMSSSSWSAEAAPTKRPRNSSADTSFSSGGDIPANTDFGSAGTIIEDEPTAIEPVATPRKSGKTKTAAVAAVAEPDPMDELPTVSDTSDPFADTSSGGSDPFASTGSAASAPTADPFAAAATPAPMVAMSMPSGGGDLVFGAASNSKRPALVKVVQKQNGASSVITIELAGSARYKIIQIPKKRQVWIDFEGTEVPGGGSSVGGSAAHVREISAKFFANESGGSSIARVIVQLDDAVVQMNDKGKEELAVTPNRGTGEASKLQLTIGAKSQQF
jgi:hypothetical protein